MANKIYKASDRLPTSPDVERIRSEWPALQVGDTIPYEDVEIVLGCEWRTERFKTVTRAWRKIEEAERKITILPVAGHHFYVAAIGDILGEVNRAFRGIKNNALRKREWVINSDPTTDAEKSKSVHALQALNAIYLHAKRAEAKKLPSVEVADRPRIAPPKEEIGNV